MKEFIKKYKVLVVFVIATWVAVSFMMSMTWGSDTCGKDYPIKYLIYSGLFCEIK